MTAEIRKIREEQGLDRDSKWDIWRDGCEGGESPDELAKRLDDLRSGRFRALVCTERSQSMSLLLPTDTRKLPSVAPAEALPAFLTFILQAHN